MKFVVTGATGLLGGATARYLKNQGHEVLGVDIKDGDVGEGIELKVGDLTDLAFADSVIADADHVVHLGAIPNPTDVRQFNVFRNNSVSTFAVFTAAAQAKVKSVVYASSLSAYGFAYSDEWTSPLYVPVDEAHPFIYEESYALSKEVNEKSAIMWSRRCDTLFVGFRFPWTNMPDKTLELARRFANEDNLPPDPRFPKGIVSKILWCHLDLRDAVVGIELAALNKPGLKGAHVFNFAAPDTIANESTDVLMKKFHPTSEVRGDISGFTAPYSSELFIKTYGYSPKYLFDRSAL
jgi:nucleoside-diphosphate-sugar epimerase